MNIMNYYKKGIMRLNMTTANDILEYSNKANMLKALRQAKNNLVFAASQRIKLRPQEIELLIKIDAFLSTEEL